MITKEVGYTGTLIVLLLAIQERVAPNLNEVISAKFQLFSQAEKKIYLNSLMQQVMLQDSM